MTTAFSDRVRRIAGGLTAALLLAAAGCGSNPTEPVLVQREEAAARLVSLPLSDARAGVQDAIDRVVPAIEDEAAAPGLETALRVLLDALTRTQPAVVVPALEGAERALAALERAARPGSGDAVHVDVIELALAGVRLERSAR